MMFHVGQNVVCIVESGVWHNEWAGAFNFPLPQNGIVYTVAGISFEEALDVTLLQLQEIGLDVAFESAAFRPLVKTDISIFTKLLTPIEPERVDA